MTAHNGNGAAVPPIAANCVVPIVVAVSFEEAAPSFASSTTDVAAVVFRVVAFGTVRVPHESRIAKSARREGGPTIAQKTVGTVLDMGSAVVVVVHWVAAEAAVRRTPRKNIL